VPGCHSLEEGGVDVRGYPVSSPISTLPYIPPYQRLPQYCSSISDHIPLLHLLSLIIRKQILTILGDDTAQNINVTNNKEDLEASDDELCPPPACEDREDSMSDGESKAPDESEKKATTKKVSSKKARSSNQAAKMSSS
jgi:hypothetical protein